jgi:hypothetical protein
METLGIFSRTAVIGYICNEYPPVPQGGIGTYVHTIAHALKKRGHSVTMIGLGQEDQDRDDDDAIGNNSVSLRNGKR